MNEILFKAWDKKEGMSSAFGLGQFPYWTVSRAVCGNTDHRLAKNIITSWKQECKFMQYTGINELNKPDGQNIFAGDVVESTTGFKKHKGVVVFEQGAFLVKCRARTILLGWGFQDSCKWKILGNIFEDKKLEKQYGEFYQ